MARPLRIEFPDAIYHLCARGNERQKVFRDDRDKLQFLELLARSCARYRVATLAFVLMGNHFHLVAQTPQGNLTRWMHWLMVSYTVYFNRRHRRSGHLFQGRYKSFLIGGGKGNYLLTVSRYLHLNSVRGTVLGRGTPGERRARLRSYNWSSYAGYAGLRKPFPFVTEQLVFDELGGPARSARLHYRRFVEEGLLREVENPWEALQWQAVLGDESFLRKVQDRMKGQGKARPEVTALRRGGDDMDPKKLIKQVAREYGLSVEQVTGGRYGSEARNLAIWLVWEKCGLTLRQIGELFGDLEYAAVAQRLRRFRPGPKTVAHKLVKQMSNI